MSTLWGVRVPMFHCLGRPCGHCQRLLGTAWCRVGGPTPTLPGHVGGCGTESRRRRTSRRLRCLSGFFLRFVGKDGLCYVLILLGCFFLWFEIYTQSCVWSWIAQINFIKNSIRFLQDFPFFFVGGDTIRCRCGIFLEPRNGMPPDQKKKAYRCDVTYVTNSHSFGTWWKWFSIEYTGVKKNPTYRGYGPPIYCW